MARRAPSMRGTIKFSLKDEPWARKAAQGPRPGWGWQLFSSKIDDVQKESRQRARAAGRPVSMQLAEQAPDTRFRSEHRVNHLRWSVARRRPLWACAVRPFLKDERGTVTVEYTVLLVVVALACVVAIVAVGEVLLRTFLFRQTWLNLPFP